MKYRNLLTFTLLSIVTLGLYSVYWLYDTRKEMVALGQKIPSFGWLVWPWVIWLILIIVPIVSNDLIPIPFLTAVLLIGYFVLIGVYLWWFWSYSKAVDAVTKNRLEAIAAYILIVLLGTIGFLIVQYYFNKVSPDDTALLPLKTQ